MQKKRRRKSAKTLRFPEAAKQQKAGLRDLLKARRGFLQQKPRQQPLGKQQPQQVEQQPQQVEQQPQQVEQQSKKKILLCSDNVFDPYQDNVDPFDEEDLFDEDNGGSSTEEENLGESLTVLCKVCGIEIERSKGYPKNSAEWAPSNGSDDLACFTCWQQKIREDFIPEVEEAQQKHRKKKANKQKKACKCGSWTHATTRSKMCPLNKKYNCSREEAKHKEAAKKMAMEGAIRRAAAATAATAQVSQDGPITPPEPVRQVTPEPARQDYQIGDNVFCKYKRSRFLGQVTGYDDGKYSIYFLDDGETRDNVPTSDIRSSDSRYPRRADMIGKDFIFAGAPDLAKGKFQVNKILEKSNRYRCTRLTGDGPKNVDDFDIGWVINEYMDGMDKLRELGVGQVLSTRTRRSRTRVGGNS